MAIVPDTKDWTWVLQRPCPDCGFDTRSVGATDVAALSRQQGDIWRRIVAEHTDPRTRPSNDRWSVLEYACHVRDVFRLADERVRLMVTEDHPTFANWDQDATAITDRYDRQDPDRVAIEIRDAAVALASRLDSVDDAEWSRSGSRSDGARFTVESFARYVIHDPIHHVFDVTAGLPS
jgi:hypothetical protein